jgi:diketogulonate reductase-like aldo/keto reductase
MVRVKRKEDPLIKFAESFTWGRHICNLLIVSILALLFCAFLILKDKEDQLMIDSGLGVHALTSMVKKPHLIYGTAWKKDDTAYYVHAAVKSGFRFIDTACQPKHYDETGVGTGWKTAARELGLKRGDMWLQTKFTSVNGQDPNNLPYDPNAPLEEQIRTSLAKSLNNLQTGYLDSWVMHSPMHTMEVTMKAWRVMEEAVNQGKVRQLGISNCYDLHEFRTLYQQAKVKPAVLQNRFYEQSNFDTELRQFCKENGVQYQSFWTLTGNRAALRDPRVKEMAKEHGLTPQTYMYAFLMSLGYASPLSGTTDSAHMAQDVDVMKRMQNGEVFFKEEEDKREFAKILGLPEL